MRRSLVILMLIFIINSESGLAFGWSIWGSETFRGKLIDADTYEPIEGAVVVLVWSESWPGIGAGASTEFDMAKEVMTDANGEWSIKGPRGKSSYDESPIITILSLITYIHIIRPPEIIEYKPGYCRKAQKPGGLSARPYIDKRKCIEGIVLYRSGDTDKERREFLKIHQGEMAFIQIDDPIEKLRSLDFPLQYTKDYRWIKEAKRDIPFFYLIGLKKAETFEERNNARDIYVDSKAYHKLPILKKLLEDEYKYLSNRRPVK